MDWKSTLSVLAPTVATALGGPLAGAAVSAIGSLLGIDEPTQDKIKTAIESGSLTGDQVVAIKELEAKYKNEEQERGFRYTELEYKDVADARARESSVKDATNQILAYTIVGGFLATTISVLAGWAKVDSVLAGTLIGYVSAKCEQVLAYYFGSSKSSDRKTELLALAPAKEITNG